MFSYFFFFVKKLYFNFIILLLWIFLTIRAPSTWCPKCWSIFIFDKLNAVISGIMISTFLFPNHFLLVLRLYAFYVEVLAFCINIWNSKIEVKTPNIFLWWFTSQVREHALLLNLGSLRAIAMPDCVLIFDYNRYPSNSKIAIFAFLYKNFDVAILFTWLWSSSVKEDKLLLNHCCLDWTQKTWMECQQCHLN